MTRRDAAIVSAYTGFMLGDFADMHKYAEELIGRPIFTHEFGDKEMTEQLQRLSKADFVSLKVQ